MKTGKNIHGARTFYTHKLKSLLLGRRVNVRYLGFHLLQFEQTSPDDSSWIKWDGKKIDEDTLTAILAFERHPYHIEKKIDEFLRDRHRQDLGLPFNGMVHAKN